MAARETQAQFPENVINLPPHNQYTQVVARWGNARLEPPLHPPQCRYVPYIGLTYLYMEFLRQGNFAMSRSKCAAGRLKAKDDT